MNGPQIWQISDPTSGIPLASRSSALLWGMTNSWRISSRNGCQRSRNSGTPSHSSRTCNVHGKCFSSAPGHDATTCCAQFPPRQYAGYAHGHDLGMQQTMEALLGRILGSVTQVAMARHITTLPVRMGAYCHGLTLCTCSINVCLTGRWCTTSHTRMLWGVSENCRSQHPDWTVTGSSLVPVGICCGEASDLDLP